MKRFSCTGKLRFYLSRIVGLDEFHPFASTFHHEFWNQFFIDVQALRQFFHRALSAFYRNDVVEHLIHIKTCIIPKKINWNLIVHSQLLLRFRLQIRFYGKNNCNTVCKQLYFSGNNLLSCRFLNSKL